jgi:peptidoglycan/xylan/chitin deacetylase (PgdA/CDA1 family)
LDGDLLPHLDIGEFEKQMRLVKRWYSVISMDELDKRLSSGENVVLPSVVVTIDDGYLNNYKLAFPVLKKLNMPSIIYLTTGFIGTNNALWVDDLMNMLLSTKSEALRLPEPPGERILNISNRSKKGDAFKILFKLMLQLEHERKLLIMQKLSKSLGVEEISKNSVERKMLSWNEVIEMSKNNISFGAHTVSHPTLSRMDVEEAKREICESKEDIEVRIKGKVRHFAVPNGKVEDFSDELKEYCKKIGMSTVVSTESGVVCKQSDAYFLRRISPPPAIYVFACELVRYMFFKKIEY